ncbi:MULTISPECIES: sensor histidine kinase [Cytobacillus]|jgi:NarL family two-component system sensor histidine kinase LiaS|uniref:Sensor histidine kinase n=1 Tax=Cytobacillus firmus TaxID=1399 RepID=A0A800NEP7_CYTFI|nr:MULTISPECIES: sensor histidine kinase [Cytobacillus]KAF0825402.1 Cell envelope stress response system LiaFSR, sensor histidine kinase LiaS(VraS) [Cytobacillus firmus]MCC3649281.1 sensor histidine kinase [Cytobacillus oceanisediminis]MCS0655625.1 sensor histidine kinase [Cytobacillus firmus]MCU1807706.1 sensor histidine kinase [Cytobacillus firmus]UYG97216.1 sensor histidine kinase [Cytobacillus firmus]
MNIIQRQIAWGAGMSLLILAVLTASFFTMFPIPGWRDLWETEILDIPFILFVPSVSLAIGLIFGVLSGIYWRRQLFAVDTMLRQVEEGRQLDVPETGKELQSIAVRAEKIQKNMAEQAKISQKLANEKAEDIESRMQEIVSQERNRLARELHDSVSQQLFAASMMMSAITETQQDPEDRQAKQLKMVEEMIHQSQLEMRALLLHLRPAALKGKSLQEGIEELLVELLQKVSMEIEWKVETFPLDKGVEDHLFRILQEAVSNTLRHSKSQNLEVLLIQRDDYAILRVADDGVGFDVEETKAGSYGLQNMYERAAEVGGSMKIISVKNKGTRLEVKVPIM